MAEQAGRRGVDSPTAAHADMFVQHEGALAELREAFPARPGQCGVILVLPDGHVCLDYLSRPDAYAEHHRKLVDGYLMDALDQLDRPASRHRAARTGCCTGSPSCSHRAGARRPASASTCAPQTKSVAARASSSTASSCSSPRTREQAIPSCEPADGRVWNLSCRAASKS